MSTELSEKEANKLFMEISGALKDGDTTKVDELFVNSTVEDEPKPVDDEDDSALSEEDSTPNAKSEDEEVDAGDDSDEDAGPPEGADGNPADEDGKDERIARTWLPTFFR